VKNINGIIYPASPSMEIECCVQLWDTA